MSHTHCLFFFIILIKRKDALMYLYVFVIPVGKRLQEWISVILCLSLFIVNLSFLLLNFSTVHIYKIIFGIGNSYILCDLSVHAFPLFSNTVLPSLSVEKPISFSGCCFALSWSPLFHYSLNSTPFFLSFSFSQSDWYCDSRLCIWDGTLGS